MARRLQQPRLQPCVTQELQLEVGALTDADVLRADARLGDQAQQVGEVFVAGRLGGPEDLVEL
jgi:hypothetical protein